MTTIRIKGGKFAFKKWEVCGSGTLTTQSGFDLTKRITSGNKVRITLADPNNAFASASNWFTSLSVKKSNGESYAFQTGADLRNIINANGTEGHFPIVWEFDWTDENDIVGVNPPSWDSTFNNSAILTVAIRPQNT